MVIEIETEFRGKLTGYKIMVSSKAIIINKPMELIKQK